VTKGLQSHGLSQDEKRIGDISLIALVTGPLGIVTKRGRIPEAGACRQWVAQMTRHGVSIIVPTIAYYEVRRELDRVNNAHGIRSLDAFCQAVPERYLPLSDTALKLACTLWAEARNRGTPTADPRELDCDVLIAAQVRELSVSNLVIATTKVGHLSLFVKADLWTNINL
jgi:hypothetical protein